MTQSVLRNLCASAGILALTMTTGFSAPVMAAADDEVLDIASPLEISGLDPAKSGYVFSRMQAAETLFTVNRQGQLVPMLASDTHVSDDGLIWHIELRDGVEFHDGSAMTAEVVASDLKRAFDRPGVLGRAPITGISAEGNEVVITLSEPFSMLSAFLAHYSTIILAPKSFDEVGDVTAIIGTGAYRVDEVIPPLRVGMSAFENWWNGKAEIEKVSYLAVSRGETRAMMAQSGDADLVLSLLPVAVNQLNNDPSVNVEIATIPRTRLLKFDVSKPFFDDVIERQALSLAIDRKAIAAVVMRNVDLAATQMFPPSIVGWNNQQIPAFEFDPQKARDLLAEAGWVEGSDGILEKDGKRFSITLRTYASWPDLPLIATALQNQLKAVGINLEISVGSYTEIPSGHADGTLEIALITRSFSMVPDPLATVMADYGPGGADWGAMNWNNDEAADLLAALGRTTDSAVRADMQNQLTSILQYELPTIPVVWSELAVATTDKLENLFVDPFEQNYYLSDLRWVK
ncbi:ABC transporter substrate-binding protein [Thalassospira sp. HJ]|uniref:ABC transporter substrate-binding protein n=1 Tax=Thalassospira sp. HJ TaxID=1616823 RepID=UPI0005CE506B|nr:ABC transporter substrate-binding protein [Thalassospira sp. HJ]KJE34350.1 ABC transporter substrate-binding protein [Thalassospira sp. HJ]